MSFFLFILIVFSGLEIAGYAIIDVLLISFFLFFFITIKRTLKIRINWVLIFCIYMILQVLRGTYVLNDYRMSYWLFFFVILYFSHLYFINYYKKFRFDFRYIKKIFNYCSGYFIIYGLLGFFVEDPNAYQGIYWIGSSAAFLLIIPYICAHFIILEKSGYSLSGLKIGNILLFVAVIIIHSSRTGLYLLLLYLLLLLAHIVIKKPRKLILILSFFVISVTAWDFLTRNFADTRGFTGQLDKASILAKQTAGVEYDEELAQEVVGSDFDRFLMSQAIYNKALSSPVEFLVGSGWYTSRQTLKPFSRKLRHKYGMPTDHLYYQNKPLQVTSMAAIVSDTGIVGLLFILFFFLSSSNQILKTRCQGRMIIVSFLLTNWIFFFVGFTFISILSYLLFLPNGILVAMARASVLPTNQLVKSVHIK